MVTRRSVRLAAPTKEGGAKRQAETTTVSGTAKRRKSDVQSDVQLLAGHVAEELLCPISKELPVDPVIAPDGHVYERFEIIRWLRRRKTSPLTGAYMEPSLVTAHQVASIIEHLVKSGGVDADTAKTWTENMEKETRRKALLARANLDDFEAIADLVVFYHDAGLDSESRRWIHRGAQLQEAYCMGQKAVLLSNDFSRQNAVMYYLTFAARGGHVPSIYRLAKMLFYGSTPQTRMLDPKVFILEELEPDKRQAKYWIDTCYHLLHGANSAWRTEVDGLNVTDLDMKWISRTQAMLDMNTANAEAEEESEGEESEGEESEGEESEESEGEESDGEESDGEESDGEESQDEESQDEESEDEESEGEESEDEESEGEESEDDEGEDDEGEDDEGDEGEDEDDEGEDDEGEDDEGEDELL